MTETPNQKFRREQHERAIALLDTLLEGFAPLAALKHEGHVPEMHNALRAAGKSLVSVLRQWRANVLLDYERHRETDAGMNEGAQRRH